MGATPFRQVAEDFFVAPQLVAADFAIAQARGHPHRDQQPPRRRGAGPAAATREARELAAANGLDYAFVPVVSGRMGPDDVAAFKAAIDGHAGPHLAYCRSGTRSCHMWAFATAGARPVDETIAAAAAAGYDLAPTRPILERLAGG